MFKMVLKNPVVQGYLLPVFGGIPVTENNKISQTLVRCIFPLCIFPFTCQLQKKKGEGRKDGSQQKLAFNFAMPIKVIS